MSDDKNYTYFDNTTEVLAPLLIVIMLGLVFGLVFFG